MSYTSAVARAKTQQSWSRIPRNTQAALGIPLRTQRRIDIELTNKFRAGVVCLRMAWSWYEQKRSQQIASKRLRVQETISLGEKRTISIVTVDGAQYLIGSSAGGVQLLTRLDQKPTNEVSS